MSIRHIEDCYMTALSVGTYGVLGTKVMSVKVRRGSALALILLCVFLVPLRHHAAEVELPDWKTYGEVRRLLREPLVSPVSSEKMASFFEYWMPSGNFLRHIELEELRQVVGCNNFSASIFLGPPDEEALPFDGYSFEGDGYLGYLFWYIFRGAHGRSLVEPGNVTGVRLVKEDADGVVIDADLKIATFARGTVRFLCRRVHGGLRVEKGWVEPRADTEDLADWIFFKAVPRKEPTLEKAVKVKDWKAYERIRDLLERPLVFDATSKQVSEFMNKLPHQLAFPIAVREPFGNNNLSSALLFNSLPSGRYAFSIRQPLKLIAIAVYRGVNGGGKSLVSVTDVTDVQYVGEHPEGFMLDIDIDIMGTADGTVRFLCSQMINGDIEVRKGWIEPCEDSGKLKPWVFYEKPEEDDESQKIEAEESAE